MAAVVVAVAVAVTTSVAIAQSGDEAHAPTTETIAGSPSPADIALVAKIAGRAATADGVSITDDLTDLLPNIRYERPDGTPRSATDLVVRGAVISVEPGLGFRNAREAQHEGTESDTTQFRFDDPQTDFRTAHLIVKVIEEIGDSEQIAPPQLRIGVVIDGPIDLGALTRGLQAADSFVFFLYEGNPVYAYDPSVYAIAHNALLLTQVDEGGNLSLPGLDARQAKKWLRQASNLAQLKEFAARPVETRD